MEDMDPVIVIAAALQITTMLGLLVLACAYARAYTAAGLWRRRCERAEANYNHLRATSHRRDPATGRLRPMGE